MSEEKEEPSADKGSRLKLKLQKMGVMRDESAGPAEKSHSFWHGKEPVIIVVFLAVVFGWWYTQRSSSPFTTGMQNTPAQQFTGSPQGYGYGPPPGWSSGPRANGGEYGNTGPAPVPPGWRGPGNRYDDRYGPPPGWRPAYPPPPPVYYGYPYYGPPANYPNPYYRGYNGPPPPQNN
jgi:hypothetical protein